MSGYTTIKVEREGAVDWVTLNRPERLNAIDASMMRDLFAYFDGLQADDSCRVVVLRGAGKGFCAGLDLTWFQEAGATATTQSSGAGGRPRLPEIVLRMRSCPQAIVALIHGAACGGGLNLAVASDIRIAGRSARMNVAYVKLGLSGCELGTSYFLPRILGTSVATELMMTGRFIHADRALAMGLVSEVVDDSGLEQAARSLVDDLLAASPLGLRKTKQVMARTAGMDDLAAIMDIEMRAQIECMHAGTMVVPQLGQDKAAAPAGKSDRST